PGPGAHPGRADPHERRLRGRRGPVGRPRAGIACITAGRSGLLIGDHMWDFIPITSLTDADGRLPTGTRVARLGTICFTRAGFARIHWDDGRVSDEWAADLAVSRERHDGQR